MFVSDPYEEIITQKGKADPNYKSWRRVDTSETLFQVHTNPRNAKSITTGVRPRATPRSLLDFLGFSKNHEELKSEKSRFTPHCMLVTASFGAQRRLSRLR